MGGAESLNYAYASDRCFGVCRRVIGQNTLRSMLLRDSARDNFGWLCMKGNVILPNRMILLWPGYLDTFIPLLTPRV
jgi:hypothetical protein